MVKYKSKIPPQVINSLERMTESNRKIRAGELLAGYEQRADQLKSRGEEMKVTWLANQGEFLATVSAELREIIKTGDLPLPV